MINSFALELFGLRQKERFDAVVSFVGHDRSGSFGLLAGHERTIACLDFGLAAFSTSDGRRRYIALPGAVLHFCSNELRLCTRRFLVGEDYRRVAASLDEEFRIEQDGLRHLRESLRRMERDMFRRIWEMGRAGEQLL